MRLAVLIAVLVGVWLTAGGFTARAGPGDEPAEPGQAILEQARTAMRQARFNHAWSHLEQARAHFESTGDIAGMINTAIFTADYHMHTAGGPLIFESIDHALDLAEQHDLPLLQAHALKQSSQYLADAGRYDEAWEHLSAAETIYREQQDERRLIDIQVFASLLASRAGDDGRAAELAARALDVSEAAGQERMGMHALSILGYSQQRLGDYKQALATYDRLIPRAWGLGDRLQLNHAYCTVAEIRRQMGQHEPAEADLREVLASLEESRHQLLSSPARRSAWVERQVEAYSRLAALLVDDRRPEQALEVIDRFKSQAFFDHLSQVEISRLSEPDSTWQAQEQELLAAIAQARLTQVGGAGQAQTGTREVQAFGSEDETADLLEARLEALRADFWHQRQRSDPLMTPATSPIEDVRAQLGEAEAMLVFWVLEERLLAWVITAEAVEFTNIPVNRAELTRAVDAYSAPMRWPWLARDDYLARREALHIETGEKLYRWLIVSLPSIVKQASDWIIIADDVLHDLPWAALIRECEPVVDPHAGPVHAAYTRCRFLIEDRSLRMGWSPSALVHQRRESLPERPDQSPSILLVAPSFDTWKTPALPDLPGAAAEAEAIAAGFSDVRHLLGPEANVTALTRHAPAHAVIHLATHGLVDDHSPLSSSVVLSAAPGRQDGLLTAAEILNLDLNADLVTLASCRSAAGPVSRAQGRRSLAQAFIHAGAREVLASKWDLRDDHAAVLFPAFYQARDEGMSAPQALRQAMLARLGQTEPLVVVREQADTSLAHPRFWAGFELWGIK